MKIADKERNKVKKQMARMKKRFDDLYPNNNISTQLCQDNNSTFCWRQRKGKFTRFTRRIS